MMSRERWIGLPKFSVSLKVGTDWPTGLLAPPVIQTGTPPARRGLYSERSKMHGGTDRHDVESAHKGKSNEDVVPRLALVPRRTIQPLRVGVGDDWESVLLYAKLYHFEYSLEQLHQYTNTWWHLTCRLTLHTKEERHKILPSRDKKKEKKKVNVDFFLLYHNFIDTTNW